MINFDLEVFKSISERVFNCDSPSGYSVNIVKLLKEYLDEYKCDYKVHNKGTIEVFVKGLDSSKVVATSAHVDTLGLMVRSIKANGNLALTKIGGPIIPTLDGEYCKVVTRDNKIYSGTILSTSPAAHVFKDTESKIRDIDNVELRLDEIVKNSNDVKELGIQNGDFVFIDPKFQITESGFLKTRFIDDKASAVVLLMLLKYCYENKVSFKYDTRIYFVVYEEVGHGASCISNDIDEFVTIDMGCVGLDLAGNEYAVSICAKDSSGPYDYELTTRLINLAKENKLNYTVDIFPYYGSDVSCAYKAGKDLKGALIGTGVSASHGMERTHIQGIEATLKLIFSYLC